MIYEYKQNGYFFPCSHSLFIFTLSLFYCFGCPLILSFDIGLCPISFVAQKTLLFLFQLDFPCRSIQRLYSFLSISLYFVRSLGIRADNCKDTLCPPNEKWFTLCCWDSSQLEKQKNRKKKKEEKNEIENRPFPLKYCKNGTDLFKQTFLHLLQHYKCSFDKVCSTQFSNQKPKQWFF